MRLSFKQKFAEICTYKSHEQCTRPTQKTQPIHKCKRMLTHFGSKLTRNVARTVFNMVVEK